MRTEQFEEVINNRIETCKTVHAEISEEQAKILGLVEDTPKTGYERGKKR